MLIEVVVDCFGEFSNVVFYVFTRGNVRQWNGKHVLSDAAVDSGPVSKVVKFDGFAGPI